MQPKIKEKLKSIDLRKNGWAITKIAKELGVAKSSVSLWVRDIPQPKEFNKEYKAEKKASRLKKLKDEKKLMYESKGFTNDGASGRFRKRRVLDSTGYWIVPAPKGYKGKINKCGTYLYEHRIVAEESIGRLLKKDEAVHHINYNKLDNSPGNLQVLTNKEHASVHAKDKIQEMMDFECAWCGKPFTRKAHQCKPKIKAGQKDFYCCRDHSYKAQKKS